MLSSLKERRPKRQPARILLPSPCPDCPAAERTHQTHDSPICPLLISPPNPKCELGNILTRNRKWIRNKDRRVPQKQVGLNTQGQNRIRISKFSYFQFPYSSYSNSIDGCTKCLFENKGGFSEFKQWITSFLFTLHQCLPSPGLGPCPDRTIPRRLRRFPPGTARRWQRDLAFSSALWGQTSFQMFLCQECEPWRSKEKQVGKKTHKCCFFPISHDIGNETLAPHNLATCDKSYRPFPNNVWAFQLNLWET